MSEVSKTVCDTCGKETAEPRCRQIGWYNVIHASVRYRHREDVFRAIGGTDYCSIDCLIAALVALQAEEEEAT